MLELSDITVRYGPFLAVDRVSLDVKEGEIIGLVGPNGAGKSSLVRAIGGAVTPTGGRILFRGENLAGIPTHRRIALGMSIVPEGRGLFPNMSVEENLLMGAYPIASRAQVAANIERAFALFPILAERRWQAAGTLSGGQQQMLAVCVGLMSNPALLILDEPSLGLAPIVIGEIGRTLRELRETHLTVLLVEQNAKLTCSVADRIYILGAGMIQHQDAADRILANPAVLDHLM
ncbi:MAG TPA: ABC transporter ATP-binding protein [Pseudorhodoplanes sp.]|jgi:branched-chain amino acid transport system ATP-binding protein|nr:ABC transporter ATP-binding protein [Pseudorhodoplanes sp.]